MKKIAVAKWLKAEIEKYANESVCYVPNGVDPKVFNIRNKKRPEHSIAMLYHKDRRKGCDISLAVVHRLKQIYPDLVVNAFGSPRHPKDWPEWIRYNRNASPQEVSEVMNNSLVFLCTSRVEGFGLTGLESIFCGCVLVSTNTKGCLEYASHDNALICNVDDVEDIVGKVCSAFDNIKLRERLLSNCRGVPEKFSIEKSKENFYKCIEDMPC